MALIDEYNQIIASFVTNKTPIVVVRFSYKDLFNLFITNQLYDGVEVVDEHGVSHQTVYAPMQVTEETASNAEVLIADRVIVIQGLNDYIAHYEDMVPRYTDIEDGVKVSIMLYIQSMDGTLSDIVEKFDYSLSDSDYAQESNSVSLSITTNPTNDTSTGEKATVAKFPTLRGFSS